MEMPTTDGGTLTIHYNNPFSYLYAAATVNNAFGSFIHDHLTANDGRGHLVLYTDQTTPGNALRPDHGRTYEAILFTFSDLPAWFVNRKNGFFKLAFVEVKDVARVVGGMAAIVRAMMHICFSLAGFNFATAGMLLPTSGGEEKHFNADFAFFLLDEGAAKTNLSVKGASGAKPCLRCRNVLGSQSYPSVGDNYLVRYSEHRRERWDPHTPASFDAIVNLLDEAAARGQPGELDELEITCGVNRETSGVLWDPYLRSLIKMPRAMFWDLFALQVGFWRRSAIHAQWDCTPVVQIWGYIGCARCVHAAMQRTQT